MIPRIRCACIGVVLAGALAVPAHIAAKPPDLPEDGTFTVTPVISEPAPRAEVLPMPREAADVTCPYLRQKAIDRHAFQPVDPQMGSDVIENLKRLQKADKLLDRAKKLAQAGRYTEAMDCCSRAAELCPGSPCAHRATETMFELAFGFAMPAAGGSEEAAEPIHETEPEKPAPMHNYEFDVGASANGGLRMGADCSLGGNVYHMRYKNGCLSLWRTPDGGKTKP